MTGSDRRKQIVDQIRNSTTPVAGKVLAAAYDVSRQVIVQDIAPVSYTHLDVYKRQGTAFLTRRLLRKF